ncbi:lipocalin-like domain-containing protein [Yoonia litorea]|uniref:Predicted secreted hydrolase n=1 Tax=Yoonia litorea TaxID=1123755 RepID=A0A1I6MZC1_9RHOB|nr:lipocalin-like domain-containing protein [Yoonia litorea]SFS20987.1 Predicted secreted hydrolase [Yoonia litorea]
MNVRVLLALIFLPIGAWAQGFAGLGTMAGKGFTEPQPGKMFRFPEDHGAHPDYRIEWWYLTANLTDAEGTPYGLQWTLFRTAMAPEESDGWASPQLWMGHAAVTTETKHFVTERLARGGTGQAGVIAAPFSAWIDDWALEGDWQTMQMTASAPDFAYDMTLTAQGPLVFHGDNGFSVKSNSGQASYYYSQPFFAIEGELHLPSGTVAVTGNAWLDREWSSQLLSGDQTGWDWFSLSFDSGDKLMGSRLQQTDGADFTAATWITPDGQTTAFPDGAFNATPLSANDADVPVVWRVTLPQREVDVTVAAINEDAWMTTSVPYWEGPVTVSGTHTGIGYLEMTGYD